MELELVDQIELELVVHKELVQVGEMGKEEALVVVERIEHQQSNRLPIDNIYQINLVNTCK
jgi:hypothetical protein